MQFDVLFPTEYLAVLPVIIPMLFAILIAALSSIVLAVRRSVPKHLPAFLAVVGFALAFLYTVVQGLEMGDGLLTFVWSTTEGTFGGPIGVVLVADQLSMVLTGLFLFMGFIVSIYSIGYMSHDEDLTQYYVLLMVMIGAMNGVVISGDLFTLFLFYETMGLSSFVLVAFRRNWEGIEAAIKYLMMSAIGSTLILYSASFLYGITGTLNLGAMAVALQANPNNPLLPILVGMLIAGFGVKGAIVPFAAWLADAHPAAPSGISALLSGVVIKVGIYGIVRVNTILFPVGISNIDWPLLLAIFALVTMTAGNFWALTQSDLKRMLAYSSITQIGFILYAFGTATELGYQTGVFYIIIHAFTEGLLFLCAGAFLHEVGSRSLEDLEGIGKKMPIVGGIFAIGVLSLMGMPPFAGFYAKFLILLAGVDAGAAGGYYLFFTVIALVNVLVALGYYLRMITTVWFKPISSAAQKAHRPGLSMVIAIALLGVILIVVGLYPGPLYSLAEAAGSALFDYGRYVSAILGAFAP